MSKYEIKSDKVTFKSKSKRLRIVLPMIDEKTKKKTIVQFYDDPQVKNGGMLILDKKKPADLKLYNALIEWRDRSDAPCPFETQEDWLTRSMKESIIVELPEGKLEVTKEQLTELLRKEKELDELKKSKPKEK
jgi:hypothetical protein